MKAIKIPVSGPLEVVDIEPDYRSIAAAIGHGCELIEGVASEPASKCGHQMYADEEGLLHEQQPSINVRASWLAAQEFVVGDVVLVAEEGPDYDIVDMPNPDYWVTAYTAAFTKLLSA